MYGGLRIYHNNPYFSASLFEPGTIFENPCLAAECTYNRATCQNLFRLCEFLLIEEKPSQILFAIEERPNFMKSTMKVQCTERDRFLRHLSFLQMKLPVLVERVEVETIDSLFEDLDRSRLCIYRVRIVVSNADKI